MNLAAPAQVCPMPCTVYHKYNMYVYQDLFIPKFIKAINSSALARTPGRLRHTQTGVPYLKDSAPEAPELSPPVQYLQYGGNGDHHGRIGPHYDESAPPAAQPRAGPPHGRTEYNRISKLLCVSDVSHETDGLHFLSTDS